MAGTGLALSILQGLNNLKGWQNHNMADVVISAPATAVTIFFEISNPIGWIAFAGEGLYFVGDEIYKSNYNRESLTEALFDK